MVEAPKPDPGDINFQAFRSAKQELPETGAPVTLMAVGDIMLSRGVARRIKARGDVHYPFVKVREYLTQGDIVFANLECPIAKGRVIGRGEMVFRADPGLEKALKQAGFNVLSLANNHSPNFGGRGINETVRLLDEVGIKHAGAGADDGAAGAPAIIEAKGLTSEAKGLTFAFLAYTDPSVVPPFYEAKPGHAGISFTRLDSMVKAVEEAKKCADFVVVSMHLGREYASIASAAQTAFAHAASDAGAELVIGHHPHVIQPIEEYQGKYILYSLGNFVFDQARAGTRDSLIATIGFDGQGVTDIGLTPLVIKDYCQPNIIQPTEAAHIFKRLKHPLTESPVFTWNAEAATFLQTHCMTIPVRSPVQGRLMKTISSDLDGDGTPETYALRDGRLCITQDVGTLWESPDNWWVDDFVLADATNDGEPNLTLSVWKAYSFGSSKPFWVDEDDDPSVKNHLFVYALREGALEALWKSSNLPMPNRAMAIADVDGDSRNELIVIEGQHDDQGSDEARTLAVWRWGGWGFVNRWRGPAGGVTTLRVSLPHILPMP